MKEAEFYKRVSGANVQCLLCPHKCNIIPGNRGICGVRKNHNGILVAETWEMVCSAGFDPVEKKPLYHFFPGKSIFSVGSIGCNLNCRFCQNWEISQTNPDKASYLKHFSSGSLVDIALENNNNTGIAYTYNEPVVWYEFMADIAKKAKNHNLKNVMVTNGFIEESPLLQLMPLIDAFSVDLKAFSDHFYRKLTSSSLLPVLKTLKTIAAYKKHLEVTNLVIPGENDNLPEFRQMVSWLVNETGTDTVLHLSAYHPAYKLNNPATSLKLIIDLWEIAREQLSYSYIGNMNTASGRNTLCRACGETLIYRRGYYTEVTGLDKNSKCTNCGHHCPVVLE